MNNNNSAVQFEDNIVQLFIEDNDYSDKLRRVRIVNTLSHVYPFVLLDLFVDAKEIMLDKIYGQTPLNLKITIEDIDEIKEEIDLELLYVQSSIDMMIENQQGETNQVDRSMTQILTICRQPYKTMTTLVNDVFENKTIREIADSITTSATSATFEMSRKGENAEKIDQVLVPPISYEKALRYLDDTFGFFNGPMSPFCRYDNTVFVRNLSAQVKEKAAIVVYYIATDDPEANKIMRECSDGEKFYSFYPARSQYIANSKMTVIAPNLHYIVKPSDRLFSQIDLNMADISKQYGVASNQKAVLFDEEAIDREKYITTHTGYSTDSKNSNVFAISTLSKIVANLSSLNLTLSGKMFLKNFMEPGASAEFIPKTAEYTPLTGRYIIKATDITLRQVRNKEWKTSVNVYLIRTHKVA